MQASSALPQTHSSIGRDQIAVVEQLIRPYVRHTPIIAVDARDFDLDGPPLVMKLELLQHTGSFKPRGAFANLLTRSAPTAGVAAASGGNHGAAVAYAANRLGIRATIFVLALAFCMFMAWIGARYATLTWNQTTPVLQIPVGFVYLALPAGFGLLIMHLLLMAAPYVRRNAFIVDAEFDPDAAKL